MKVLASIRWDDVLAEVKQYVIVFGIELNRLAIFDRCRLFVFELKVFPDSVIQSFRRVRVDHLVFGAYGWQINLIKVRIATSFQNSTNFILVNNV